MDSLIYDDFDDSKIGDLGYPALSKRRLSKNINQDYLRETNLNSN